MEEALDVGDGLGEDQCLDGMGIRGQGRGEEERKADLGHGGASPLGGLSEWREQNTLKGSLRGEVAGRCMAWEAEGRVRCPCSF